MIFPQFIRQLIKERPLMLGKAHQSCKRYDGSNALLMYDNRERYIEQSRTGTLPERKSVGRKCKYWL